VFRIRIRVDPDSNCQAGSGSVFGIRILKVKLSYKNPLFSQFFLDFHLFLKMTPNKSSLFNKIPTWLVENKIPVLFGLKTKISPKILFLLWKICFLVPGSWSGIRIGGENPGSGSVKNESGSESQLTTDLWRGCRRCRWHPPAGWCRDGRHSAGSAPRSWSYNTHQLMLIQSFYYIGKLPGNWTGSNFYDPDPLQLLAMKDLTVARLLQIFRYLLRI